MSIDNITAFFNSIGIPQIICYSLGIIFVMLQVTGEIIEIFGKNAPIILKLRKLFTRHKERKAAKLQHEKDVLAALNKSIEQNNEVASLLLDVKTQNDIVKSTLQEVNNHYSKDNITLRNCWMDEVNTKMQFVEDRAAVYDAALNRLLSLEENLAAQSKALDLNNKMTSELYKQNTRTDILNFSHKIVNARKSDKPIIFSREEFKKIRKTYRAYEEFLSTFGGTNGEVDDAMAIIRDAEAGKLPNIEFLEDLRD